MSHRRLAHLRAEDGIALVVAIILMAGMLTLALAAIQLSDSQSKLTSHQLGNGAFPGGGRAVNGNHRNHVFTIPPNTLK